MESQAKTGTDGILMVVEEPETLVLPEEVILEIRAEENFVPLSILDECGKLSAWQGREENPPCRPPAGGEDFHLTVMLEGGYVTSSIDGLGAVAAGEEVTRESPGGGEIVGDRSGDATITSAGLEQGRPLLESGQTVLPTTTREKTTNTSDYLSGGITLTPSFLVGSGRKVYVPPPDPGSLEYVGVDSQSVGFWYDGGRNLYSCPTLPDNPLRVPSISELSLVCKSMLQWSNKLKQLRQSVAIADSKLAQTMKDYFIPRVKSATQRQPKDPNHVQRLVPLEHLKQLVEVVRSKASIAATTTSTTTPTEVKPSPLIPSSFVPAAMAGGGGMLVVPSSTCHSIPVLPLFSPHFMFPSPAVPQCLDKAVTFAPALASGGSSSSPTHNPMGTGGREGGECGEGMQTMTVEQGLALAQALFSTSGILQTDLGQPIILSVPPLLRMTVTDPVRVDTVDFMSKSIEISGETPIRAVEVATNQKATLPAAMESGIDPNAGELRPEEALSQLCVASSVSSVTAVTTAAIPSVAPVTGVDHYPTAVVSASAEDTALTELAALSQTHTSTEVMSAKMLLSLTGKEWCMSPVTSDHTSSRGSTHPATTMATATTLQSGSASSAPGLSASSDSAALTAQHSKRTQRKQKPIASARQVDPTLPAKPPSRVRGKARGKGAMDGCGEEEATVPPGGVGDVPSTRARRVRRPGVGRKRIVKDVLHQEDLSTPRDLSTKGPGVPGGTQGAAVLSNDVHHPVDRDDSGRASDQLQELKAQQSEVPVKEYVIDTDSDSDSSSSSSTSDTGSSTEESSSESTSEGSGKETFLGGDPFLSGQGIVGGRKGGVAGGRRGHVVKIPRHLLSEKLKGKSSRTAESEADRLTQDIMADHPLDLATLYAHQGALDLSTLSEITQQPSQPNSVETTVDSSSRSKRTCVRVREQIHRLREILEGDSGNQVSSPRSRGRTQKRGGEGEGGGSVAKRSRRSGYRNQFTHKRRKKRKKPSEDEPLWQSARKNPFGSTPTRVFVFSTNLANRAAESVERGEYDSIIQFHQAQPKGPGFFRPANESQPDEIDQSPGKGDTSHAAPRTKQSCSPNSVTRWNSAASSPGGVGVGGGECDPRISPASLPSRTTQSRPSRRLKKQSSWAGNTSHSPPLTPGEMLGSAGRTRNASPLPYKSPTTDNHEGRGAFRWGNERDPDEEEHGVGVEERLGGKEGRGGEDWSGHMDRKSDVKEHYYSNTPAKPSSQRNQSEAAIATLRQHAVNHRSEVDSQGNTASPAMMSSPANSGTAGSREDANYTICHGTPGSAMQGDISSPIPATRGMQGPSSVHSTSETSFSPRPSHTTSSLPPRGVQPQMEVSEHYGGNSQQVAWNPSNQYPPPGSVGGGGGYHPHHPQLSGLSYSAHPMAAMQVHSGYPYALPYPWGHVPPARQHHQLSAEEVMHAQQMGAHVGYMHHPPPPPSMMEEGGVSTAKEAPASVFLPNPSPLPHPPPLTSDTLSPVMSQTSHLPPTAHHSAQSSHGHHLQRHYQALPPDYFGHPSAHLFPYGFEGAGLQQMHHLWSHPHGGGQLPPASAMHPGHMMPGGHGSWYPSHLVHSMVSGVEVHGGGGEGGKMAGKKGSKHEGMQVVDVKLNTNGNNNVKLNNNGNNNNNNGDNKQMERRESSLEQPLASRLCSDDCSPTVSVSSGAVLLPLQPKWPCSQDTPISVEIQKSQPFSVKVNWCK